MNNSYVYRHINRQTREVFYIGIGTTKSNNFYRSTDLRNRNKVWHNYVNKHGEYDVEIIISSIPREEACKLETEMIKKFGRVIDGSGRLTNISFGGERTFYGMVRTPEHTEKIRQGNIGKKVSPESKEKMRLSKIGYKASEVTKAKMSTAGKGRRMKESTRLKIISALTGRKIGKQNVEMIEKRRKGGAFSGARKKIICLNDGKIYESVKQASEIIGVGNKFISGVLTGKRKHTKGLQFNYVTP